jgi:hypothetical protein
VLAARIPVVGKRHIRTHEHIILQPQPIPHLHARLNRHPVADDHVILDQDMRADVAVGADAGVGKDDDELPNAGAGADVR